MTISVIIPVYNTELLLNRCLDSIFSQTTRYDLEVICVDDGSTDGSVDLIKHRKENIILLQQTNSGPSKARNRGVEQATGKYLAFIDADDYWLPGFIDKTVDFLESHTECVGANVIQRHCILSGEIIFPILKDNPQEAYVIDNFFETWFQQGFMCTGSSMLRTDVVKATGGMREDLRICEDVEFWWLISTYGKIGMIPEVLFVSDGTQITKNVGWVEKNRRRWASAIPLEQWERRIVARLGDKLPEEYKKVRGKIAQNLIYSIMLSKRYDLAYEEVKKYQHCLRKNTLGKLFRLSAKNRLFWWVISRILTYREYHR